jgi:hypothetical protein
MQRAGAVKANVQAANGKVTLRCVVARNSGISKSVSSSLCWVGPEPVLASDRVFHTETQTIERKRGTCSHTYDPLNIIIIEKNSNNDETPSTSRSGPQCWPRLAAAAVR